MSGDTWVDDDGALAFLKGLRQQRDAQVVVILGLAATTQDPALRAATGSLQQLDRVINQMEEERGATEHRERGKDSKRPRG